MIDQGDEFLIWTALEVAVAFSQIYVDVYFLTDWRHGGV